MPDHRADGVSDGIPDARVGLIPREEAERIVASRDITDEHLRHLSPLGWEHIALTGVYRWDLADGRDGRLRPLRS